MGPEKACARVVFSPNGRFLVTSSLSGATNGTTLQLWETSTGRLIRNLRLQPRLPWSSGLSQYGVVAFSPDGRYVAFFERIPLGGGGPAKPDDIVQHWQTASIWDVSSGQQLIHTEWKFDAAKQAAVNKDISWTSKQIESWIALPSPQAAKWDKEHPSESNRRLFVETVETQVIFSPDEQYVARVGGYGDLWNVHEKSQISGFCTSQVMPWKALSLSRDGNVLAAASTGKSFIALNLQNAIAPVAADAFANLKSIAIASDTGRIATATRADSHDVKGRLYFDGQIAFWNGTTLQKEHPVDHSYLHSKEFAHPTMSVAFSPDGSRLVAAMVTESNEPSDFVGYSGLLEMWDPVAAKLVWKRALPDDELSAVAFSPDGKLVATGHQDVLVKLYDAATSSRVRFFDDKQATATDPMWESRGPAVLSLAFSPDGKTLASGGSSGHLFVWDVRTGKQLAHLSEPHTEGSLEIVYYFGAEPPPRPAATRESVEALVFSTDGKRLYSAGCEGIISIWDTADWKQIALIPAAEGRCVRALAASPDGKWLMSSAEDGQILFWDTATNKLAARLLIGTDAKQWLVVGANGLFDGTEEGIRTLAAWRVQNRLVSLSSLPTEFRVKGLLQKILSGQTPAAPVNLYAILEKQ
jgi:WD40 repeat protein